MQIVVSIGTVGAFSQIGEILPPCDFFNCPVLTFFSRSYAQGDHIWGKYVPKTPQKWA